jgi:hypothetical protein
MRWATRYCLSGGATAEGRRSPGALQGRHQAGEAATAEVIVGLCACSVEPMQWLHLAALVLTIIW